MATCSGAPHEDPSRRTAARFAVTAARLLALAIVFAIYRPRPKARIERVGVPNHKRVKTDRTELSAGRSPAPEPWPKLIPRWLNASQVLRVFALVGILASASVIKLLEASTAHSVWSSRGRL